MAIKCYVGRMGSGKTYEVVSSVIFEALARGRRVISNIAGLDYDEFYALLVERGTLPEHIGKLVLVTHDEVLEPLFWRTDKDAVTYDADARVIQCGDLVALDENWRFWEGFGGKAMPERVMNFFRMHRHFLHPQTGVACDVALISQDVMDFSRKVRAVIEETYYMEKLTAVGSAKRYRVDVHQGGKIARKPLRQIQRSYDSKFFPLYSSHSMKTEGGAAAKEENIDNRGNILHSAIFKIGLPLAVVLFLVGAVGVWKFFHKGQGEQEKTAQISAATIQQQAPVVTQARPQVVSEWRVVGWYRSGGSISATLQNAAGRIRIVSNPPAYKITAAGLELELPEGGFVTPWSLNQSRGVLP